MPTITLANNIGQPTTEQIAQTVKPRFTPVTVDNAGGITPAKEIPVNQSTPAPIAATLESAVEAAEQAKIIPPKPKTDKELQDSERFNALARREKAMRAKIRENEQALAASKAQIAEYEALKQQEAVREEKIKADPIGFLVEKGYNPDQITQALLNQPGPESQAVKMLTEKILKIEHDQQAAIEKQNQDAAINRQNALKTLQKNVDKLVTGNPEYRAIEASDAQKSVTTYIEKVWDTEGIILETEEAAKEIEGYLKEQFKKVQSKLEPPKPKIEEAPKTQEVQVQTKSPTLTNKTAQNTRPLTARERAILAFKRELK